jgi:hypothetical protein
MIGMSFKHGVYVQEVPTKVSAQQNVNSAIPVVFGTAPKGQAQVPVLVRSYAEAVEAFGYSDNFDSFTLSEFISAHFLLYKNSQAILVNVLDIEKSKKATTGTIDITQSTTLTDIQYPVLDSIKIKKGSTDLVKGTDYVVYLNDVGYLAIRIPAGSTVVLPAIGLTLTYDVTDPSKVKNTDLIGGLDSATGKRTGFELLDTIIPSFGVIPGLVLAPKYSTDPSVAVAMTAKAQSINTMFKAFSLVDLDTKTIKTKKDAIAAKKTGDPGQYICWPKISFNGKQYHISTHLAGAIAQMDAENNGIPSNSPSNRALKADGCILADGTPVTVGLDDANDLNGAGIGTMLSFIGGPRVWGNRTSAYPNASDVKDVFISAKRMMFWINNWIIVDTWRDVDGNITKRFVESITDRHNLRFNGLVSMGALLGGRCVFNPADNPPQQMLGGKIKFELAVGIAPVAESVEFSIEVDTEYLSTISG